jgi:hypothetical protein
MTSKGWLSAAVLGMGFLQAAASDLPNIVLILADDMGWSDLGCYGGEVQTPNIDRLAAEGIRFTQAYNTSKCFPSRAALLTGLYAQQCGYAETFTRPLRHAMTLGEVLQAAGYKTYWSGKHHGVDNPEERGFDRYYGLRDGASNHFNPGERRMDGGVVFASPGMTLPELETGEETGSARLLVRESGGWRTLRSEARLPPGSQRAIDFYKQIAKQYQ